MTNKCSQPNLICEIGVNHEGNIDLAINMIEQIGTAANNPHVRLTAKFQAYKASKLASQNSPACGTFPKSRRNLSMSFLKNMMFLM